MPRAALASAQAKFVFWIRPATLNARLRLAKRVESCDVVIHVNEMNRQRDPDARAQGRFQKVGSGLADVYATFRLRIAFNATDLFIQTARETTRLL